MTRPSPRRFVPVSAETTGASFEQELRRRTDRLRGALNALEPAGSRTEQRGVWTVEGRDAVTDRVIEFFAGGNEEIVYTTVDELLTDEVVEALGDTGDRGVEIQLGGIAPAVGSSIRETVQTAETLESLWVWSDTPAGRLLMTDRERVLVSVVLEAGDGRPVETGTWGVGETNGLVVVLKTVFTWRLGEGGAAES